MPTTTTGIATSFIDFTRASNATVTDSDGKVKWAPHNLLTNSESFDAASWTKNISLIAANSIAAPNGTTTADKLYPSTSGTKSGVLARPTAVEEQYTLSVYAKAGGKNFITFTDFSAGSARAWANLSTGAKTETAGYFLTVTDAGSGWWRCEFTQTAKVASPYAFFIVCDADSSDAVTVNGTDGIYIWGAALYRSDLGGMQPNTSAYPMYNPTTPKNLLGYTEDFSNAYWIKGGFLAFGAGSTVNATIAPNGLPTADLMTPDTTVGLHRVVGPTATVLSGTPFRYTVYVKPNGYTKVAFREMATTGDYAAFSLTGAGSVLDKSASATATISALPDGWYLISTSIAAAATLIRYTIYVLDPSYTSGTVEVNWTPNGTSGIYLWGAQLSDSASLDSYVPVYGAAVTSAAYYGPRRDFDGATLACKGLLVEEQRANLITSSSALTDFVITPATGLTSSLSAGTAPDGTNGARLLTNTTTNEQHRLFLNATLSNTTTYTYSVYAKRNTADWIQLILYRGGANTAFISFNLATGAKGTEGGGGTSTITPVGGGWYRCTLTATTEATACNLQLFVLEADSITGAPSYAGTIKSLYIYGAQLEAGSFATSYIPVGATTAGATRNADVASLSTQAFPYGSAAGSWVVSATSLAAQTGSSRYALANSTGNVFVLYSNNADTNIRSFDGTNVIAAAVSDFAAVNKFASAYGSGSKDLCTNGGVVATGTYNGDWASTDRLYIGSLNSSGNGSFFGHIRQITYIPRRLSNAELQTRTV